jgi:thymidylate synthase
VVRSKTTVQNYLDLLQYIYDYGEPHNDRTGVGTRSVFGASLRFDLDDGNQFPLLTTKRMPLRLIFHELMWFLSGSSDVRDLWKHNVHIWDGNYNSESWQNSDYYREFSVGLNYGEQWRKWNYGMGVWSDQIRDLLVGLNDNPYSRRHIVTAWNPIETHKTALPPCHIMFQVKVHHDDSLSLIVYIRSGDMFLGIPFNIASYALLLMLLARATGRRANGLGLFFGDLHIYNSHLEAVETQLARKPFPPPRLELKNTTPREPTVEYLLSFTVNDLRLHNYDCYAPITAPLAV